MNPNQFTFIDLFCGLGGIRLGFEGMGGHCVFSSDFDVDAQRIYELNFGESPYGDITLIPSSDIPAHDLLLAGFPCQPFSIIGGMHGFSDTRGTLFFEIERILHDKRPYAFLLENVKQLKNHDHGRTFQVIENRLKALGYHLHVQVLNSLNFGLPQKRERVFIVGFQNPHPFRFPTGNRKRVSLASILEPEETVDSRYFASDYIREKRWASIEDKTVFYPSVWHENKGGNVSILPYSCALRAGASFNYLLVNGKRRLTPREQLRLQGFPETYQITGTESQIRKLTGNSVSVPVIREIAQNMLQAIQQGEDLESGQLNRMDDDKGWMMIDCAGWIEDRMTNA